MLRKLLILLLFAVPVRAGDAFEAYFYIVGSIPSEFNVDIDTDIASQAFRDRLVELTDEWVAKCGPSTTIWHTGMMHDDKTPWTEGYWFAYISDGQTHGELLSNLPDSPCAEGGYIKRGFMVIPGVFQMCAAPAEFGITEDQEICN